MVRTVVFGPLVSLEADTEYDRIIVRGSGHSEFRHDGNLSEAEGKFWPVICHPL